MYTKIKETGDTRYIYPKIKFVNKACFQHDMAYNAYKDLARRTASYKVLPGKTFQIVSNPQYYGYQRGLASMVHKFFDKKFGKV